jgi:phosphatidylglycerophosphatase C
MVAFSMTQRIDPAGLVEHLARTRRPGPTGMAFDADGTLWSGDVGEDVFEFAYERGLFRDEARDALARVARDHELLIADGTASELARRIYSAYRAGSVGDRLVCEVMTWAYAGFTTDELRSIARQSFAERHLASRLRPVLAPILDWARRESIRIIVVSASPREIVVEALAFVGLDVHAIAGASPKMENGRIAPSMSGAVPFAGDKCTAGLPLLSGHDWLASFGDNSFDVDLLKAARVSVAVCPKPALAARLGELDGAFVLG